MKYTEKLDIILTSLAEELNISDTMYERAVQSYTALGDYIKKANKDWEVEVYPQGSFEMGTVVKPISDEDQYDVDLVVLVKSPPFGAKELRDNVTELLENYGRYEDKIEDKKRCIRIQYSDSSQFHMDIACAKEATSNNIIFIAQHDNNSYYNFCPSNPLGYIAWFKESMRYSELPKSIRLYESATTVKPLPLVKVHTPLQQAIQLLKRHRDIYFENYLDNRPSSIIITTLCALSYDYIVKNQFKSTSIYETIKTMLENFNRFIIFKNNEYFLENPIMTDENFLANWKENKLLKSNFDSWIAQAKNDIITDPINFIENDPTKLSKSLKQRFGESASERALNKYGSLMGAINKVGALNINKSTMSSTISQSSGDVITPQKNTFFGD